MPIGIMEFMMDHQTMLIGSVFESAAMLEKHGFRTVGFDELAPPPRMRATLGDTLDAIDAKRAESVLREMTDSFRLPLAQCWVACPTGSSGRGAAAAAAASPASSLRARRTRWAKPRRSPSGTCASRWAWARTCRARGARVRVGEMVWVDDVTKGSQLEWPLPRARGLPGACATSVWLDAAASAPPRCTRRSRCSPRLEGGGAEGDGGRYARSSSVASRWGGGPGRGPGGLGEREGAASRGRSPLGVTLDRLRVHFDKHLKDAARDLGVGSTTLKRICRRFGINRWPARPSGAAWLSRDDRRHVAGGATAAAAAAADAKARPSPSRGHRRHQRLVPPGRGRTRGSPSTARGAAAASAAPCAPPRSPLGASVGGAAQRSQSVRAGAVRRAVGGLTSSPGGVSGFKAPGVDEVPGKAARLLVARQAADRRGARADLDVLRRRRRHDRRR